MYGCMDGWMYACMHVCMYVIHRCVHIGVRISQDRICIYTISTKHGDWRSQMKSQTEWNWAKAKPKRWVSVWFCISSAPCPFECSWWSSMIHVPTYSNRHEIVIDSPTPCLVAWETGSPPRVPGFQKRIQWLLDRVQCHPWKSQTAAEITDL